MVKFVVHDGYKKEVKVRVALREGGCGPTLYVVSQEGSKMYPLVTLLENGSLLLHKLPTKGSIYDDTAQLIQRNMNQTILTSSN